jgi:predicted nucleic acid-binding protein
MAHLVDSSVWIALFLMHDTQHKKAEQTIKNITGIIYLPYCVLSEVTTVLTYKHSKAQADAFIAYAEENKDIRLMENTLDDDMASFKKVKHAISFTDSSLLGLSKKLKIELITFDKQLERAKKLI